MKCMIPEISWHNRDPVLSIDIQPRCNSNNFYRLASGGTDSHVLIWHILMTDSGSTSLDLAADLMRHQKAVNCVRWSPSGELLASSDDESVILVWKLKCESEIYMDQKNEQDKELWFVSKILRGHMEDVYDLSWSPNSENLLSGSVDNTAIIWNVHKGKQAAVLGDHRGFVQGVAWDPQNIYAVTLSTDRYLRSFDVHTYKTLNRINKSIFSMLEAHEDRHIPLFHDDTLQTFFRRMSFSPDGNLIAVPSGVIDLGGATNNVNVSYIFSRYSLKQPIMVLPSPDQFSVAIKFCPLFFKLRPYSMENPPVVSISYRMIFAIATKSCVYFYDTQQKLPFGLISNIHYTRLTDVSWSSDGKLLIISSTDGFCSLVTFEPNELGEIYTDSQTAINISVLPSVNINPISIVKKTIISSKEKLDTFENEMDF